MNKKRFFLDLFLLFFFEGDKYESTTGQPD
jgi:hypothetical protein